MATARPAHVPVLVAETLAWLSAEREGWVVDCTVGLGGHAEALLERFPDLCLFGIDRDAESLALARERLGRFGARCVLARGLFSGARALLESHGIGRVQGVFADLGVSSLQLERAGRGFSFRLRGPLDMRMGEEGASAAEIVNSYPEEALATIFREHGEEPDARRIARAIVDQRQAEPLTTTVQLAGLIERLKRRPRGRRTRLHPATRVFQALRIEVNRELHELRALLDETLRMLERDGRLVVISYHSLEDRLVKNTLRELASGEIEPITGRPRAETQVIEVLTKKPVRPSPAEVVANPRARSARLRAARRL